MAEKLAYDVTATDRASRVLGDVSKAMKQLGDNTTKLDKSSGQLADAQLKVRSAMLGVTKAEGGLADARSRLDKITKDSTASDKDKRKAALAVEDAEIRHARALRGVQTAGEGAAKTARTIAAAQRDNEQATKKASLAARMFGRDSKASAEGSGRAYAGLSKSMGGVRVGVGSIFKGMAVGVPVAGALGVGVLALGKHLWDTAVNLDLMDRKAKIVLGTSFPGMTKWAKAVSQQFGMTSREIVGMTAGFADMLVPMGLTREKAAAMGKQFASMAPVLSRWSGGTFDVQQTTEALTGALTGEYDTLQRLGIPISDAKVQEEALRLGLVKGKVDTEALSLARQRLAVAQTNLNTAVKEHGPKSLEAQRASIAFQTAQNGVKTAAHGSTGEITQAAKAQAALSLIMSGSTDAQKAFAQGADSLATKQAAAKARFGEVRDAIISALIPALSKLGQWFLDHQDDVINFGFQAAASIIGFGKSAGLAIGDILIGFGKMAGGLADFLDSSDTTWIGVARGAAMALGIINPSAGRAATAAVNSFERLRTGAVEKLRAIETKSTAAGTTLKAEVEKGANAAGEKLEMVRRKALNIPNKTLTQITADERDADAKIADIRRKLRDPELTKTRKAKLQADLAKWEAQKKQIARDKAQIAKAVYVPAGATAAPGGVKVIRVKDKNGVITGIRFGRSGQGFATGGPVFGEGTATSDSVPARLSKGEHVLTAREVQGFGGHYAVERMRKQAARAPGYATGGMVRAEDGSLVPASFYTGGGSGGIRAEDGSVVGRGFYGPIPLGGARIRAQMRSGLAAAADAGLRDAVRSVTLDALKREGTGAFNANLGGALSFARSQAGKPYIWGGVGPGGYDCSGFLSALVNVAQGRSPYQRRFSTGTLPAGLFRPGTDGALSIGWFQGKPGHTAGTINGVNVESRGGEGVVVGSRARGARSGLFSQHGSLKGFARGGRVGDPAFDAMSARGIAYRRAMATRWPTGGDGSRAKEARLALRRRRPFFEDFSYRGESRFYALGNDRLAAHFWKTHRGFDFDGPRTGPIVGSWLNRVVSGAVGNIRRSRHVAMAGGGIIDEPVYGIGQRSGRSYSFAERGPETVTPGVGGLTEEQMQRAFVAALRSVGMTGGSVGREIGLTMSKFGSGGRR